MIFQTKHAPNSYILHVQVTYFFKFFWCILNGEYFYIISATISNLNYLPALCRITANFTLVKRVAITLVGNDGVRLIFLGYLLFVT